MKNQKILATLAALIGISFVVIFSFQNCAKTKFNDPDPLHTALVTGLCQLCDDTSGAGIRCRVEENGPMSTCIYESCKPGFVRTTAFQCAPVICEANVIANCTVPHGEGRMTCKSDRIGYGPCDPISCETGYELVNGACQAIPTICVADSHRDCSTATTYATETCNAQGTAYGSCVMGDCKPGFNNEAGGACVANICTPNNITPCTVGAGSGFKTCNSKGSAFGTCEINGCEAGYTLVDHVCVVQTCTPGSTTTCAFNNGTGEKTCSQSGLDYGTCQLNNCNPGMFLENGECLQQNCTPSSRDTCTAEGGTGVKYCYENGRGHGPCQLSTCDPGFKLENGQCVRGNSCNAGETFACSVHNGTGIRVCTDGDKEVGPCVATACSSGYVLVTQNGTPTCKKDK
ncbi:MAG: hypothetical protein V4736_01045 [Bdellovibrionota bacterium]